MIKSFTVTNYRGESLKVILREPEKSGLYVDSIEGLGPVKATINTIELATSDGGLYSSARIGIRNIVLTLGMMFCPTVEDSRQKTYQYFPVKSKVMMRFETDNRAVETQGYVESNEPNIFSKTETAQISIICVDPFFYATFDDITSFYRANAGFEFPFSNESLTEPQIVFGEIPQGGRIVVSYRGDVDTGVSINIHGMGTATGITLYDVRTSGKIEINTDKIASITGAAFGTGDDIIISTVKGNKFVKLLRNGVYTNIIGAIEKNSEWFQLKPGSNVFAYTAQTGGDNLRIDFSYRAAYGGI